MEHQHIEQSSLASIEVDSVTWDALMLAGGLATVHGTPAEGDYVAIKCAHLREHLEVRAVLERFPYGWTRVEFYPCAWRWTSLRDPSSPVLEHETL